MERSVLGVIRRLGNQRNERQVQYQGGSGLLRVRWISKDEVGPWNFLCGFEEGNGHKNDLVVRCHYGGGNGSARTEIKTHDVSLSFYTLKVKEGWQKRGRTDDNDGKVVV